MLLRLYRRAALILKMLFTMSRRTTHHSRKSRQESHSRTSVWNLPSVMLFFDSCAFARVGKDRSMIRTEYVEAWRYGSHDETLTGRRSRHNPASGTPKTWKSTRISTSIRSGRTGQRSTLSSCGLGRRRTRCATKLTGRLWYVYLQKTRH